MPITDTPQNPRVVTNPNSDPSDRIVNDWTEGDRLYALPGPPQHIEESPLARNPGHRGRRRPRSTATGVGLVGPDLVIVPMWEMVSLDDDKHQDFYRDIWDSITLGPFTFAGTCKISGEGPKLSVDKRRKKGALTQRLITNGYDTSELKITLRLWTKTHKEDYEALVGEVNPKRTGKPFAIEVYHPALALAKIQYVLVYGVGLLLPSGEPGIRESTLSCFEFIPQSEAQRNATRSATQAVPLRTQQPELHPSLNTANDNPNTPPTPSQTAVNP